MDARSRPFEIGVATSGPGPQGGGLSFGGRLASTSMANAWLDSCGGDRESWILTVNWLCDPAAEAFTVPEIRPELGSSVNPEGNEPDARLQV